MDLVDVLKDHIESESLIKARLTLVGGHLHLHPNIHLQAEYIPEEPPPLECAAPYRWTIDQLNLLLQAVVVASRGLRPGSLVLPAPSPLAVLQKLTQAPGTEHPTVEQ